MEWNGISVLGTGPDYYLTLALSHVYVYTCTHWGQYYEQKTQHKGSHDVKWRPGASHCYILTFFIKIFIFNQKKIKDLCFNQCFNWIWLNLVNDCWVQSISKYFSTFSMDFWIDRLLIMNSNSMQNVCDIQYWNTIRTPLLCNTCHTWLSLWISDLNSTTLQYY